MKENKNLRCREKFGLQAKNVLKPTKRRHQVRKIHTPYMKPYMDAAEEKALKQLMQHVVGNEKSVRVTARFVI